MTSVNERLEKKHKRDLRIFCLYMVVGAFGLAGACFSETIPQCLILVLVSVFAIACGLVIKKQGTEETM